MNKKRKMKSHLRCGEKSRKTGRVVSVLRTVGALSLFFFLLFAGCDGTANQHDDFVPVTDITGIPSGKQTGVDLPLSGTVVPSTATNKTIVWSIAADDNGSTVPSLTGNVLKTTAEGTVKVTATIANGLTTDTPYTKTFTINVTGGVPAFVAVTSITGVPSAATAGVDLPLTGTVAPATATNKTIVWSIAAANTLAGATVVNGVLKTTTAGTAKVTATIVNGATASTPYTETFTITVTDDETSVPCECNGNAADCECEDCDCDVCNGGGDPESLDVTVNFTGIANETITLGNVNELAEGGDLTVTVSGAYASYAWYVDGVEAPGETSNEIVILGAELGTGAHTVTAIVEKDDVPYSKVLNFEKGGE